MSPRSRRPLSALAVATAVVAACCLASSARGQPPGSVPAAGEAPPHDRVLRQDRARQEDRDRAGDGREARDDPEIEPGPLPALVAAVPGALVHGAGHWAAGDPGTAGTLLAAEGLGVGLIGLGGLGLWLTRGGDEMVAPLFALVGTGVGVFVVSWLADIWGSATGGRGAGVPRADAPPVEVSLGYRWIHDPQFDYDHFAVASASLRPGRFRLTPSAWVALDDRNERWRLEGAVRLVEATADEGWRGRGSYLDAELATTWHDYHDDRFQYLLVEGSMRGRLDLGDLATSLRGSFAELSIGYGMQLFDYDAPGTSFAEDAVEMLLLRWAFGVYLGHGEHRFGEVRIFYDHRRDGFVGGLGRPLLYDSIPGHVGLEGHAYFTPRWGVDLQAAYGSSLVLGAGLRHRFGGDS